MNPEEQLRAQREIEILKRLDHPNIIRFLEMVDTTDRLYLFMEFMEGGHTLMNYMNKQLSESEARYRTGLLLLIMNRNIFKQIVAAINYCHSTQVVHRDIKPNNILMSSGRVKLIDFGLSAV